MAEFDNTMCAVVAKITQDALTPVGTTPVFSNVIQTINYFNKNLYYYNILSIYL